jgi:hypothetical protein
MIRSLSLDEKLDPLNLAGVRDRSSAGPLPLTAEGEADDGTSEASSLVCASAQDSRKEPDVAGKKRPKSLVETKKTTPAKPKRPKKTSRGK